MDAIVRIIQRINIYIYIYVYSSTGVLIFQHEDAQNLLVKLRTILDSDEKYIRWIVRITQRINIYIVPPVF